MFPLFVERLKSDQKVTKSDILSHVGGQNVTFSHFLVTFESLYKKRKQSLSGLL